ncbi:MAG: STAS domain-containing protein [Verrucomicrobiota bacterium]
MSIAIDEQNETLRLTGDLDIYAADQVRTSLIERLASGGGLVLDLAQVASCDATGLQVLCALQKTATENGRRVRLEQLPDAVRECCAGLGVPLSMFISQPC